MHKQRVKMAKELCDGSKHAEKFKMDNVFSTTASYIH
jgi:hypothetical protein